MDGQSTEVKKQVLQRVSMLHLIRTFQVSMSTTLSPNVVHTLILT